MINKTSSTNKLSSLMTNTATRPWLEAHSQNILHLNKEITRVELYETMFRK